MEYLEYLKDTVEFQENQLRQAKTPKNKAYAAGALTNARNAYAAYLKLDTSF